MAKRKHKDSNKKTAASILLAAEEVLGEVGYDGASVMEIARRAGVNKALVFYHWGSKADLFEQVLERYYSRHRDALSDALDSEGSLTERFHNMVDAYMDFIDENRLYPRLVQQQISGGGPHLELVQRHLEAFFSWTTQALAKITPESGPLAARHFYLSLSGIVVNYFTYAPVLGSLWGQDPLSPEAVAERREHVHWLVDTMLKQLVTDELSGQHNKESINE